MGNQGFSSLFEVLASLKVNFHKRQLLGVNVDSSWLEEASTVLNCKVGGVPFVYLGLPIGANPRHLSALTPVVEKIRKRLSGLRSKYSSFGG